MNIAVVGANGRMGQEILAEINLTKNLKPMLGVVRVGKAQGFLMSSNLKSADFKKVDVIIDFSSAENFSEVLKTAAKNKTPLVSGVTGISSEQDAELKKSAQKIPILWSANMSLGVAALRKALAVFAELQGFDFQIEEVHHNKKKDKPSGTAKTLQSDLNRITKKINPEPLAIRGGGIFGIHKVYAISENEYLSFEHVALNRKLFAVGAIKAAEWIVNKKNGLYEMKDIL